MGMKYTGRCHRKGCHNFIDESMARLAAVFWFYCSFECAKTVEAIKEKPMTRPTQGSLKESEVQK